MSGVDEVKETKFGSVVIRLPKIISAEILAYNIKTDPIGLLTSGVIRTSEELNLVLHSVTNHGLIGNDFAKALILALDSQNLSGSRKEVIEWYINSLNNYHNKDILEAFRFLLGFAIPDFSFVGTPMTRYLCSWNDDCINKMIKRRPWLYWCHYCYQAGIQQTMNRLTSFHGVGGYCTFPEHEWQGIQRIIRRIVQAKDWYFLEQVSLIENLYCANKLRIREVDLANDQFLKGQVRAFLHDAVRSLKKAKRLDTKHKLQDFGPILKKHARLNSVPTVEISGLAPILEIPKGKEVFSAEVCLKFTANNRDNIGKLSVCNPVVELSIEGGFFPGSSADTYIIRSEMVNLSTAKTSLIHLALFEGRARLKIVLIFAGSQIIVPYYIEVKRPSVAEEKKV